MSSKFPMNPPRGPQARPPQMPEIDQQQLEAAMKASPTVMCDACGNATFENVIMFKKLSKLVSPSGQEGLAPIPSFACVSCGHVNEAFLPIFLRSSQVTTETTESANATVEATGVGSSIKLKLT